MHPYCLTSVFCPLSSVYWPLLKLGNKLRYFVKILRNIREAYFNKFDNYLKYCNLSFFIDLGLDLALIFKLKLTHRSRLVLALNHLALTVTILRWLITGLC